MEQQELLARVKEKFGAEIKVLQEPPDLLLEISREKLVDFALWLRDDPALHFDFLVFVTAVDRHDYLEVVYRARSLKFRHEIMFKVKTPAANPEVPSLTGVWPAANWDEREVYDLFGVTFTGHPNLKRILLPDDWEGHPLRKSYPVDKRPAKLY